MTNQSVFTRHDFRQDRFVQYDRLTSTLEEMKFVYEMSGQNGRPLNLALIGEGGSGKTSLVRRFVDIHRETEPNYAKFGFKQNISFGDLPPLVTRRKFLSSILNPSQPSEGKVSLSKFATNAHDMGLKLIIIDEFSELNSTSKNYKHEVLHTMRWIGNNLKIPFIVAGTGSIENVFSDNPEMGRRFDVIKIPRWKRGRNFEYFVMSYLNSLPGFEGVREVSPQLFRVLLAQKSRTTFDVTKALSEAAFQAYTRGDIDNIHKYARVR